MAKSLITIQEMADRICAPEYRQPLKTVQEAVDCNGWGDADKPICCGATPRILSCIGSPYFAECEKCGRFIVDVSGPSFSESGSSVRFLDTDRVDIGDGERVWIAGKKRP